MINLNTNLILVKGEDKTASILRWRYDRRNGFICITYSNGREYSYRASDVQFFKAPNTIVINNEVILDKKEPIYNVEKLQFFGRYCRIINKNGYKQLAKSSDIRVVRSALDIPESKNCFEYLKQIAIQTGLYVEGRNILASQYEKIDYIREDSVLASYLSGEYKDLDHQAKKSIIYPFGFNLSQKRAVENALGNQISIIEGPPGTGKTQTILNIIANVVMRGESVAVVSSNNSATANVYEKLQKYKVEFIAAQLGNSSNKLAFIKAQSSTLPNISTWEKDRTNIAQLLQEEIDLNKKLEWKNELSALEQELSVISKEYQHFSSCYTVEYNKDMPRFSAKRAAVKILAFLAEYEIVRDNSGKIGFFKKWMMRWKYGLKKFVFSNLPLEEVQQYCQSLYYEKRIKEIKNRICGITSNLDSFNFDAKMKHYADLSMEVFKSALFHKYAPMGNVRQCYSAEDLWKHSEEFIKDYPVILSTTYSLRASLSKRTIYDYVIVDEASQVDVVTGALALSCAKKAVIVGDLKQLPNVVTGEQKAATNRIFKHYGLQDCYNYANHSLLSSMSALYPNVKRVLLREHYRCHPEIIGFCNQRFYNNELIILTKPKTDKKPLVLYKTVAGNHARDHFNQRQIDVIMKEVFPQQGLNVEDNSVGIVTPYRNQANALQKVFAGTTVKADTADKFQGQERNVMVFSTVDNEIGEFASDPNRLNVAVSRAIDQFIVVTDGNDNDNRSPIHDLIGYIQYQNYEVVNSNVHSVFDYLYKQYAGAREEVMRKFGKASDVDSENLMYQVIREVLQDEKYSKFDVVLHVPMRTILRDLTKLTTEELVFATNHLTHVDFLIYSKLTHEPLLVIEVDGFAYHTKEKQMARDIKKDEILRKYGIPMLRLSTTGSNEKEKLVACLESI